MIDPSDWSAANERYLEAGLAWLRLKLTYLAEQARYEEPTVTEEDIAEAAEVMRAYAEEEPPPALIMLSRQFEMSPFERDLLLLCSAMEFDGRISALCGFAQGNPASAYPTFALASSLLPEPAWDALSPERPLRYWRLVEFDRSPGIPLTASPLQADTRIVNYLKGLNGLDERLIPLLTPLKTPAQGEKLPLSQKTVVDNMVRQLEQTTVAQRLPVIQLVGPDADSKRLIASHVAATLGLQLFDMSARLLPASVSELEGLARLWHRESSLSNVALYLDAYGDGEIESDSEIASWVNRFLRRSDGLFFLDSRDVWLGLNVATLAYDIRKPSPAEQQAVWASALGARHSELAALLAGQFSLSQEVILDVARSELGGVESDDAAMADGLWKACLVRARPRLDALAERLEPKATWDDIVLPAGQVALLQQIAAQVRQRGLVYETWGFRDKLSRGLGIAALFAGESGTGKTMAAEVLANELQLNLYRIDLSGVVSKYIGETEKNLRRLFDAGEDGGAVLFFDEADALFGKRSQVRDSHDRYANIEINYLLQRMEAYQGLAILSTNRKSDLDEAFIRRLRFIVVFPFPGPVDRKRMWKQMFPAQTPVEELDYDTLARFKLTGGSIRNIALNAAFLAALSGKAVTMDDVLSAARTEFLKMERLIDEADFRAAASSGQGSNRS